MQTKVTTKGQVVLPGPIRRQLGIRAGDPLDAVIQDGRVVLTPRRNKSLAGTIVEDPKTGLPVLYAGPDAPELTSEMVAAMLAELP